MDEIELTQIADFLSIALEQIERENYEVAEDFVQDVYATVEEDLE